LDRKLDGPQNRSGRSDILESSRDVTFSNRI